MSPAETSQLLTVVASYWPNFRPDDAKRAVTAWYDALAEYDIADAEAAVQRLGRAGREFAPPPGVVREAVAAAVGPGCPVCGRRGSHVHERAAGYRLPALPDWTPAAIEA